MTARRRAVGVAVSVIAAVGLTACSAASSSITPVATSDTVSATDGSRQRRRPRAISVATQRAMTSLRS